MQNDEKVFFHLQSNLNPFKDISNFSTKAGIYAIGFIGEPFPLKSAQDHIKSNDIIYVGKTENSQRARDENGHFKSGESGNSTVRRTLGAILRNQLGLSPMPRSFTEASPRRFRNYKFTLNGENRLTDWMMTNLSLSYWEWEYSVEDLREMEKRVIKLACPILNLKDNPFNKWRLEIRTLRNDCRDLAEKYKDGSLANL